MDNKQVEIIVVSAHKILLDAERKTFNLNNLVAEEEDLFSFYVSEILDVQQKLEILIEALNDVFKRACELNLDTIPITKAVHKGEKLLINLNKEIYKEVPLNIN